MATKTKGKSARRTLTTGVGTCSFPHLFPATIRKRDDGSEGYEVQIIIPKSDRAACRALLTAVKEVGEEQWGANWKGVKNALHDGDREKNKITGDGTTAGERYPERANSFFFTARTKFPIAVVDRQRNLITDPGAVYAGCKIKLAVDVYAYSNQSQGIGFGLNGVQFVADGEPLGGGGKPAVETMFDVLDDEDSFEDSFEDDEYEDDEPEPEPKPRPRRTRAAAKPAATRRRRKPEPEPEPEDDDEDDLYDDDEDEDEYEYDDL